MYHFKQHAIVCLLLISAALPQLKGAGDTSTAPPGSSAATASASVAVASVAPGSTGAETGGAGTETGDIGNTNAVTVTGAAVGTEDVTDEEPHTTDAIEEISEKGQGLPEENKPDIPHTRKDAASTSQQNVILTVLPTLSLLCFNNWF